MSTAFPAVALTPDDQRRLRMVTGHLLALVALASTLLIGGLVSLVGLLAGAGILLGLLFPRLPSRIGATGRRLAVTAVVAFVVADFALSRPDLIDPLIRMVTLLLLLRGLAWRRKREDLQLLVLALFLVLIGGVLTLALSFALQLVLFTPLALLFLFLVTLTEDHDPRDPAEAAGLWQRFSWRRFLPRLRLLARRTAVGYALLMFALVLVLTGLIFVLMPRFQINQSIPMFSRAGGASLTGFSDEVRFGEVAAIINDEGVALRADFASGDSPAENLYWRMAVLDLYAGRGFRASPALRLGRQARNSDFIYPTRLRRPDDVLPIETVTLYYEGGISRYLPLLGGFRHLRLPQPQELELNPLVGTLRTREIGTRVLFYQLVNAQNRDSVPPGPDDDLLDNLATLWLPPDDEGALRRVTYPRTTLTLALAPEERDALTAMVARITREQDLSAVRFAQAATTWLQSRHAYSLSHRLPDGAGDPLVRWLQSDQPGHCEMFAGALVLLARTAGHPARLVTGFSGGDWNGYEQYLMVRHRHAHAWVELWDGDAELWRRIDPTPGSGRSGSEGLAATRESGDRTWGAYLDSLRVLWYRRVVNFDQQQQQAMVAGLQDWADDLRDFLAGAVQSAWQGLRNLFAGGAAALPGLLLVLTALAVAAAGCYTLAGVLRRWRWRRAPRAWEQTIRNRAAYWLRRLQKQGAPATPEFNVTRQALERLRFDDQRRWPEPAEVFAAARRLSRQRRATSSSGGW